MDLNELRSQIDSIDEQLVSLFVQRMEVASKVADYKKEHNLPIYVPAREREILQDVAKKAGPDFANYTRVLYSMMFELSRSYQRKQNTDTTPLYQEITDSIENTSKLFPQAPMVACQGVEGAFAQIACEKMFKNPFIMYFKNFDGVFSAIEKGLCQYGILPIENSTAGSVKKVPPHPGRRPPWKNGSRPPPPSPLRKNASLLQKGGQIGSDSTPDRTKPCFPNTRLRPRLHERKRKYHRTPALDANGG